MDLVILTAPINIDDTPVSLALMDTNSGGDVEETDVSESKRNYFNSEIVKNLLKKVTSKSKHVLVKGSSKRESWDQRGRLRTKVSDFIELYKVVMWAFGNDSKAGSKGTLFLLVESLFGCQKAQTDDSCHMAQQRVFESIKTGSQGKVKGLFHVNFLENQEYIMEKVLIGCLILDFLTPSRITFCSRKENYADSKEQRNVTDEKEVPLSSEEQALHDELMNLMHQESLAKAHNDDQRVAFEGKRGRILVAKGNK
ncbi:hypothetical protein Tco_0910889 [Tanacetum coccineum]|uniref:Uncharacterized protein n=1 Tax=Tanacetum coccineum TaxID=301880 RepID=A0ABQ5D0H7_9ASTR